MKTFQKQLWDNTLKRGVIPNIQLDLLNFKFFDKLQEELNELIEAYHDKGYIDAQELSDCFIVVCNCASANNIDIVDTALEKSTNDLTR